jgi:thiamine-monophosphate kinase
MLTELSLIQRIRATALTSPRVPLGIGDDCAILRPPANHDIVLTTDFSLEDRHFRRDTHSPQSAGHRTLARGLSDLAAMGATPLAAFLSLALPKDLLRTRPGRLWFDRFLEGFNALAAQYKLPLAGGDTAQSPSTHILADIVLTGTVPRGRALRRDAARPGDHIYVTGALGGAAAQLQTLFARPTNRGTTGPQLFPQPRLAVGQAILRRRLATACMDLSDGLSTDLTHLCQSSNLTAAIEESLLPIHPLAQSTPNPLDLALNGGEDYELLFTAAPTTRIPKTIAGVPIHRIGTLHPASGKRAPLTNTSTLTLLPPTGPARPLPQGGWQHLT